MEQLLFGISVIGAIAGAIIFGLGYIWIIYLCFQALFETEGQFTEHGNRWKMNILIILFLLAMIAAPIHAVYVEIYGG